MWHLPSMRRAPLATLSIFLLHTGDELQRRKRGRSHLLSTFHSGLGTTIWLVQQLAILLRTDFGAWARLPIYVHIVCTFQHSASSLLSAMLSKPKPNLREIKTSN